MISRSGNHFGLVPAVVVGRAGSVIVAGLAALCAPALHKTVIETDAPMGEPVPSPALKAEQAEDV